MLEKLIHEYLLLISSHIFPSRIYINKREYKQLLEETNKQNLSSIYNSNIVINSDWYIGEYDGVNTEGKDIWWVCGFPDKFYEEELDEVFEKMIPKHE